MYIGTEIGNAFSIQALYTAFDEWIQSEYFFVGERHDFWELVLVTEGEVGVTAGENAWVLKRGQAVIHPPMEFHRIWYAGTPGRIIVFSFDAAYPIVDAGGSFAVEDMTVPEELLRQTRRCFTMDDIAVTGIASHETAVQILLKRWELFLLELVSQKDRAFRNSKSRTAKNYSAIVQVLESHIHENLSIAQIAELCNMSQISVKQTFSRYAGMGIINYFNRLKIQRAILLLQNGSSVQETADMLGFSSQNYFSTVFKRIMGKPPTAYK